MKFVRYCVTSLTYLNVWMREHEKIFMIAWLGTPTESLLTSKFQFVSILGCTWSSKHLLIRFLCAWVDRLLLILLFVSFRRFKWRLTSSDPSMRTGVKYFKCVNGGKLLWKNPVHFLGINPKNPEKSQRNQNPRGINCCVVDEREPYEILAKPKHRV